MSWAFREAPTTRKGDLLVLLVLADHAHDDGGGAYPSVATIARLARMTDRGVQKALTHLRDAGLIAAEGRTPSGTTIYRLATPELSSPPNSVHPRTGFTGGVNSETPTPELGSPKPLEPSLNRKGRPNNYDDAVIG
jgi:pyocin large subunit-like protein